MPKKTLVLGLGISGKAAAAFLRMQGKGVLGIDGDASALQAASDAEIECQHESVAVEWSRIERVVVSPGIPPRHPICRAAMEKGVEVIGEAELALPHFRQPLLAVTGTNGKTTVALLVEHLLNSAGVKAKALGNVGNALCDYLLHPGDEEAFVVELSSFQLETMHTPVFSAAALLNITPDHLDWHGSMEAYAAAKCRLQRLLKEGAPFFVQQRVVAEFGHLLLKNNYQNIESIEKLIPTRYRDRGKHESENAAMACALCQPFSLSEGQLREGLETFRTPPHRIEFICTVNGVSFYDDSKGTNIDAVIKAVNAMPKEVILIAGGVDKGASYLPWKEHFCGKVKQIIVFGQAADKIYCELHSYFKVGRVRSLADAVECAFKSAKEGDSVLLSPGCSSFDMFRNYKERGEEFQRQVLLRRKS